MSDSLLHRWSKQKTQADETDQTQVPEPKQALHEDVEPEDTEVADTDESQSEEQESEPVELPPIESLGDDSDYSMFMSPEVDDGLRKLALRKLFKAPFFNVVDGLNDYDDDFTSFEGLGDIVTSDMKFHEERKKAEEALKKQQSLEPEPGPDDESIETLASEEPSDEHEKDEPAGDEEESRDVDESLAHKDNDGPDGDEPMPVS